MNFLRGFFGYVFMTVFLMVSIYALWIGSDWAQRTYFPTEKNASFWIKIGAAVVFAAICSGIAKSSKK